jgi:hypothetical protein
MLTYSNSDNFSFFVSIILLISFFHAGDLQQQIKILVVALNALLNTCHQVGKLLLSTSKAFATRFCGYVSID